MTTNPLWDDARMEAAVQAGMEAFFSAVAAKYPEVTRGDFLNEDDVRFFQASSRALRDWLVMNHPHFDGVES